MNFLQKIQNLPVEKRKIIFWMIMIILICLSLYSYWLYCKATIKNMDEEKIKKGLQLEKLKEGFEKMPKIETPEIK